MKRWGVFSSIALLVAANVFVLGGVALDRTGGIVQSVDLSQRELPVAWTEDDNSGIAVQLAAWDQIAVPAGKLVELGFDCSVAPDASSAADHYRRQLAREALIVLGRSNNPPLKTVDAGRDLAALQARYPAQAGYIIVRGIVRAQVWDETRVAGWCEVPQRRIHVPQPYARTLRQRAHNFYYLTLCYGKRLEPWVCGCRP